MTDHSQLTGVVNIEDDYAPEETAIHLTGKTADNLKKFAELEIIESTDEETIPTDFNIYSALKSKLEDDKRVTEMEEKFIRKDKPDGTDYLLTARGGINIGDFISGLLGSGARINEKGEIEACSLQLWEFLNVPELRFNRVRFGDMRKSCARNGCPANRIGVLHGRMKAKEKEAVMSDFAAGQLDILVSTTVRWRWALNVPNAVVMLIENAERYGLSPIASAPRARRARYPPFDLVFYSPTRKMKRPLTRLQVMCRTSNGF